MDMPRGVVFRRIVPFPCDTSPLHEAVEAALIHFPLFQHLNDDDDDDEEDDDEEVRRTLRAVPKEKVDRWKRSCCLMPMSVIRQARP